MNVRVEHMDINDENTYCEDMLMSAIHTQKSPLTLSDEVFVLEIKD